jgi:NADPH-dependent ferric siderophore reductase
MMTTLIFPACSQKLQVQRPWLSEIKTSISPILTTVAPLFSQPLRRSFVVNKKDNMPSAPKWMNDALEGLMGSLVQTCTVVETAYLNSHIKITQFKGDLSGFSFAIGYAVAIRVNDTDYRNYTPVFVDVEQGTFEIIAHLHGMAPGSTFFDQLTVGDTVRITLPRGQKQYDQKAVQQVIVGDETSLALVCSFLPELKKNGHRFQFYFELEEDNKDVPGLLGLEHYTVFPKNGLFRNENWIHDLPVLNTSEWRSANFILTGNVASVQAFRRVLKRKQVAGKIYTKGYWLEGKKGL